MAACSEGSDCYSENTSTIKIDFYKLNELDPDTSFYERDTITFGNVYAIGNRDSLLVDPDSTWFSTLVLPVDPRVDTTAYVIGLRNRLTVKYDIRQRVLSPDCDVEQVFSNLDTISTTYDSLVIKSRNLDRNEINFEVYGN